MPHCAACGDEHPDANSLCPRTGEVMSQGPCGSRIDRYDIERWIGGGGMGAVYLARHTMLRQRVALKLLNPSIAQRGDILERFLREARATASLGNANIVKVFDCAVTAEGVAFIAMEALEGESLQSLLDREKQVDATRSVAIIAQVLDGLAVAHAAGIVHRDMKPANVFVSPGAPGVERATILDFGISKIRSGDAAALTQTGTVMGTPHYMAPEQIWNAKDIDHRADLYAVGVMLYEMLSGRLPFDASSTAELLVKACTTSPIPLRELGLPIASELVAAVDRAMMRDASERFQSAGEFATALRSSIASSTIREMPAVTPFEASRSAPLPRITVAPPRPPAPPTEYGGYSSVPHPPVFANLERADVGPRPPVPASRRNLLIVVAVVLAALALLVVGALTALYLYDAQESGEPTAPGLVPLGPPTPSSSVVVPNPGGGVTIVPGPEGLVLHPTANGLRLSTGSGDASVMIPITQ